MASIHDPDKELVSAAQSGNKEALEALLKTIMKRSGASVDE